MKASLAVHSYNEGPALERLILSSLHAADFVREWVVLDHRSSDDTQAILDRLAPLLAAYGIPLVRLHEGRDLSREVTFAHVRDATVQACKSEIVALMDADFVLGIEFRDHLARALRIFGRNRRLAAIRHRIPIIWDHISTDNDGRVVDHGRLFLHGYSHRLLRRNSVRYRQTGNEGRWEKATYPGMTRLDWPNDDGRLLVSLNIKPRERLELRATMTEFMREAVKGRITGNWLDQDVSTLPTQPAYDFRQEHITPVLNLAGLEVSNEATE